ncbi:MAG: prepilin peptidase [Deltaproteobacteria bacterium]|nr:prepilin peptidase [Deltaproteobacteria bacterium]
MVVGMIFAGLFGLALGSFLNVCIYRIPSNRSIVYPPSSCPNCGERIKFYDNLPVISYFLLLGRCRYCRHAISPQYPVVEAITGALSLALFLKLGASLEYLFFLLFGAALLGIAFIDLHHKMIPDVLSLPGIVMGFVFSLLPFSSLSWIDSLIGTIGGGGFLLLVGIGFEKITGREGMGMGDVKMLAMIGAWMGWKPLLFIILLSSLAGSLIGGTMLVLSRQGGRTRIPFGPFLTLGTLLYLFFGSELTQWYFRLGAPGGGP